MAGLCCGVFLIEVVENVAYTEAVARCFVCVGRADAFSCGTDFCIALARSFAASSKRCVGRIRWAFFDSFNDFFKSMPLSQSASASSRKSTGSSTTPFPIRFVSFWNTPDGMERSTYFCRRIQGCDRRWPSLEAGHGVVAGCEHIHYLSFSFVAPLQAEQNVNFHLFR